MKKNKKHAKMIDGRKLIKKLKEWREQITPDHLDPIVEIETLENVELLVRFIMGITEEDDEQ